ncbi:MAG: RloB family protein [Proteocatella sp.]
MRERHLFQTRSKTLTSPEVRKKYFLIYEGICTEEIYFNKLIEVRHEINIQPLIELIPLIRDYSEKGYSNPKKILECLISYLDEVTSGTMSYKTLFDRIIAYLEQNDYLYTKAQDSTKYIWQVLTMCCQEKIGKQIDHDVDNILEDGQTLINELCAKVSLKKVVENIIPIFEQSRFTYDKNIDEVCLIVDRDRDSFIENTSIHQYTEVLQECRRARIKLYVSNPCFEFWLLLHFDRIESLDRNALINGSNLDIEKKLKEFFPKYSKAKYDAEMFVCHIDKAIENERFFCEDPVLLESSLGSNIGLLIQELQGKDS